MAEQWRQGLKGSGYELFIFLLSILSMANLVIVLLLPGSVSQQVAVAIEFITIPIFLFDFLYRLRTAPSRPGYLIRDYGWADLVAVIPLLRVFRVFRVIRVIRVARESGTKRIVRDLVVGRASATFFLTMFLVILVVEFAGDRCLPRRGGCARGQHHQRRGRHLVGPGDHHHGRLRGSLPRHQEGRVVGVFLLFAGIALFSVLTGFIANAFLAPRKAGPTRSPADGIDRGGAGRAAPAAGRAGGPIRGDPREAGRHRAGCHRRPSCLAAPAAHAALSAPDRPAG